LGCPLLMRPCFLVNVCLLLVWCTVPCALSSFCPLPMLPGDAHPPSAPSGVPRPKPLWGKACSPDLLFFFGRDRESSCNGVRGVDGWPMSSTAQFGENC
jgi:hypothetical protein